MLDPLLIDEGVGFRTAMNATGQILIMCQHLEDEFANTSNANISTAYDTVNKRLMLTKLFNLTLDAHLTSLIGVLLTNRRFYVQMGLRKSKWSNARNGPAQGVLAPLLFNIYTNDQPLDPETRNFIHADDQITVASDGNKSEIETKLSDCLNELNQYFRVNLLKANPVKTVSSFST